MKKYEAVKTESNTRSDREREKEEKRKARKNVAKEENKRKKIG